MVMFGASDESQIPFYQINDLVMLNVFKYGLLSETDKEVLYILDDFCIMSSKEMVESNKSDDNDKRIGYIFHNFDV